MRIIATFIAIACLSGCALYDASPEERSEFRSRTAEVVGAPVSDVRVFNVHGLMLNTNWSAQTPKGHFYCSRDLNNDVTCRRD